MCYDFIKVKKMKKIALQKINKRTLAVSTLCVLSVIIFCIGSYTISRQAKSAQGLKEDKKTLQQQLQKSKDEVANLKKQLSEEEAKSSKENDTNQTTIKDLQQKITDLEKRAANQTRVEQSLGSLQTKNTKKSSNSAPSQGSSAGASAQGNPYDRIEGDVPAIKEKVKAALRIIEHKAPAYYQVFVAHVTSVNTGVVNTSCIMGGVQSKRTLTIYAGAHPDCMLTRSDNDVASLLLHEIKHIHSVYVEGNHSTGKSQELPSYYVQREYLDILSVSQTMRNNVHAQIAYWESQ